MAKKKFENVPFPPLVRIDTNQPLSVEQVSALLRERLDGVSFCIRSQEGHPERGGYFFHILPTDNTLTECKLYNFEKIMVATLSIDEITFFVNHSSGLEFNEWAFQLCQTVVNFRLDPSEPDSAESDINQTESIE